MRHWVYEEFLEKMNQNDLLTKSQLQDKYPSYSTEIKISGIPGSIKDKTSRVAYKVLRHFLKYLKQADMKKFEVKELTQYGANKTRTIIVDFGDSGARKSFMLEVKKKGSFNAMIIYPSIHENSNICVYENLHPSVLMLLKKVKEIVIFPPNYYALSKIEIRGSSIVVEPFQSISDVRPDIVINCEADLGKLKEVVNKTTYQIERKENGSKKVYEYHSSDFPRLKTNL